MTMTATGLKEIHDLREQMEAVNAKIDQGRRSITTRRNAIEKKKSDVETLRAKLKQLKVTADGKALQLKTSEAKIYDLQGKLNAVATNREFDALKSQIAADKMANSVLEDEIFEALEGVDAMQVEVKKAEDDLATIEKQLADFIVEVEAREPTLQAESKQLQEKISGIESILPSDIAPNYRRLVDQYGARALAPVTGKACGECFVGLTAQSLMELKAGKFKFCTCGRLMYFAGPN